MPGVKKALVIAESDKRGTIFGMFHLSELLGISPLVDWAEVRPAPREQLVLDVSCCMVSREPSVRYRGIFINDEWPAMALGHRNVSEDSMRKCMPMCLS